MRDRIVWVRKGELARGNRPGWLDKRELKLVVPEWTKRAKEIGVRSIVCLLNAWELKEYYGRHGIDLLGFYRRKGFKVASIPVSDYADPPLGPDELAQIDSAMAELPSPWLIHCSAGIDRTGTVIDYLESKVPKKTS